VLSAFLIALREGVEAALVFGIILVYLARTGRSHLSRFVWSGVAVAGALSLAVAIALERWQISEDGFEGLMLLLAAAFVISMILWMNRVARHLRKDIEQKIENYAVRAGSAAGWGIFLFVFLMVLREGAELALVLRAVLSSEGIQTWIGTIVGLAAAIAVGLFYFKGTLKIPLHRFFAATTLILWLVTAHLAITGLHELSEARWLPSSKTEMAMIGPIVRNEIFFFVFIFGAAILLILREWLTASHAKTAEEAATNDAEKRLLAAQQRRQRNWMIAAASACLAVILVLTADFIYVRANSAPPSARVVSASGAGKDELRVPLSEVRDGNLHLFTVNVSDTTAGSQSYRFLIIKKPQGWGVALDACRICGAEGYRQDGQNVVCRHCGSAIYVPTIGESGGCNPVGAPFRVDGEDLVVNVSAVMKAFTEVPK